MTELVLFVILGATSVAGGLTVVLARNPIYSAMGLLGTMFSLAVLYVVHLAHFVAAVQVLVYAGAVVTLFLFVIMLIGVDEAEDLSEQLPLQRWLVLGLTGAVVVVFGVLALSASFRWVVPARTGLPSNGTIEAVSSELFSGWVLPVVATAILLTISAVGAIALAYFRPKEQTEAEASP